MRISLKMPKSYIFGLILATNIETNKRPPEMIYLHESALGIYWDEYGTGNVTICWDSAVCDSI